MSLLLLGIIGAVLAVLWLATLVLSGFNIVAVSLGLLALLLLTGQRA